MSKSVYSAQYKRLLRHLVNAREERGLTQVQLAQVIGKPQSFISKAENGERRLDVIELLELLEALRVDPVEFLRSYLHH